MEQFSNPTEDGTDRCRPPFIRICQCLDLSCASVGCLPWRGACSKLACLSCRQACAAAEPQLCQCRPRAQLSGRRHGPLCARIAFSIRSFVVWSTVFPLAALWAVEAPDLMIPPRDCGPLIPFAAGRRSAGARAPPLQQSVHIESAGSPPTSSMCRCFCRFTPRAPRTCALTCRRRWARPIARCVCDARR